MWLLPTANIHLALDIYLHVTYNCIYCLYSNERGINTMCTVSTKYQRERHIRNFERVLFNNSLKVVEYICIGIRLNRSSSNQLWYSTFHGPICLQIYFHRCILKFGRINMFCKWYVFVLSHCIYNFSCLLLKRNTALKFVYLNCAHLQYYFYSQMKNEISHKFS